MEKIDRKNLKLDINSARKLSHSEAVKLITEFFQKNDYKYNRKELKSIQIQSIETLNIHKYVLETFYETREFALNQKPFSIDKVETASDDEKRNRPYQNEDIWKWEVKPKSLFQDEIKIRPIEDETIESCKMCLGKSLVRCKTCNGQQQVKCADCNGQGVVSPPVEMLTYETPLYDQVLGRSHVNNTYQYGNKKFNERELSSNGLNKSKENTVYNNMFYKLTCAKCKGNKVVSCKTCKSGQTECLDCNATGKVVRFVELKTNFHTKVNEVYDKKNVHIPTRLLNESLSNNVFYEQKDQLEAISESSLHGLTALSKKLLEQHSALSIQQNNNSRILCQRHYANQIPVTICKFIIDGKPKQILIFGFQQGIFDPQRDSSIAKKCNLL